MKFRRAVSILLPLLMAMNLNACVSIPKMLYGTSQTTPLSLTLKDGTVQRYMEYVPPSAKPGKKLPLIVMLHGSGEAGSDTYAVLANGPWHYADNHPDFPFIILAPQENRDAEWSPEQLDDWLVQVEKTVPVDRRRVYLTGLSRGGQGTWDFAMRYPQHFAAIAPVSGYSNINQPCRLKGVAVWAFHGAEDGVVPIKAEKAIVAAAKACGVDIHYTIYPGAGHFIWERTYNDPDLYSWFLEHRRPLFRLPGLTHLSGFSRLRELRRDPSGH